MPGIEVSDMNHCSVDLFEFWREVPGTAHVHPLDEAIIKRMNHGFNTECLLTPYMGCLKKAPVVLLFLSAGLDGRDKEHGESAKGQAYYQGQRNGESDLPAMDEHESAHLWVKKTLKQFTVDWASDWEVMRSNVAFLNISPYKSKELTNHAVLTALPSCRAALDWAQFVLFPQAEREERVVVCLRSAAWWGLGHTSSAKSGVFVPKHTRRGHVLIEERPEIDDIVRSKLGLAVRSKKSSLQS
jgi:hypothetical protein